MVAERSANPMDPIKIIAQKGMPELAFVRSVKRQ
jgi:hypothetical protein